MNYFKALVNECEKLDKKAQKYLDQFEFLTNDEMGQRIHNAWCDYMEQEKDDNDRPEWAEDCMDGIPFCCPPRMGSLFASMGTSLSSLDAHLRNLLEAAEGRESYGFPFPIVVDYDFWKRYPTLKKDIVSGETH